MHNFRHLNDPLDGSLHVTVELFNPPSGAVLEGGPGGASAPLTLSPAPPAGPPERGVGINNTNITIAPPPPPSDIAIAAPPVGHYDGIASHPPPPPPSDITMASHRTASPPPPHPPPRRTLRSAPPTACRPPPGPPNKIILEPAPALR